MVQLKRHSPRSTAHAVQPKQYSPSGTAQAVQPKRYSQSGTAKAVQPKQYSPSRTAKAVESNSEQCLRLMFHNKTLTIHQLKWNGSLLKMNFATNIFISCVSVRTGRTAQNVQPTWYNLSGTAQAIQPKQYSPSSTAKAVQPKQYSPSGTAQAVQSNNEQCLCFLYIRNVQIFDVSP